MSLAKARLMAARGDRGGFTLVEVLIAMVVLAVGLLALESLAIGASRSIATANRMTEYTLIASQQLETTQERVRSNLNPGPSEQVLANGTLVQTMVQQNVQPSGTLWTITVTVTPPSVGVGNAALTPTTVTGRVFM
ncbi:MAG: prepilin-type N-terminal cleavage/methylation domain-containing protein [Gemmatimonadetes bacterium]|nr:prepilin-type N-terminal cleavage/methylation domain-containing protein [Gemmatimonadota bacterium]